MVVIDKSAFTNFANENANGAAICITSQNIHLIFSNSIFTKCRGNQGGAISVELVTNINATKICGYQCSSKLSAYYGFFAFLSSTNLLDASYISACYNSGFGGNCYFSSKNEFHSNSNHSNNNGNKELTFITSQTTSSTIKYIISTSNIGSWIGINSYRSSQIVISYLVYENVSLTSKAASDYGHITSHITTSCDISWFYIEASSTYLPVFNCIDSSMTIRNSFVKCPSDKLIDSRGNIKYDSSVNITSEVPKIEFSVQKSEECGKIFQESHINYHQFGCFLSINQLLLVLNSIIIS